MHVSQGCAQLCVGGMVGRIAHPASKIVLQTRMQQLVIDILMFELDKHFQMNDAVPI
jgi:hypothetical protein